MYMLKVKEDLEEKDMRGLEERINKAVHGAKPSSAHPGPKKSQDEKSGQLLLDDLPDGACIGPRNVPTPGQSDEQTAVRKAQYIGSFSVVGSDQQTRVENVQKQLEQMRDVSKSKHVSVVISLAGIKVCSTEGNIVYMAHALKRISYATCDPDFCQFSFLAREPKGLMDVQYCHAFITETADEAEELNAIIGNAFKMAYAKQREKQPTFHELIAKQVTEQQAHFRAVQEQAHQVLQQKLTAIATPTPFSETAIQRMEMRRQPVEEATNFDKESERDLVVGKNKIWAKHAVDKVKHRNSGIDFDKKQNQAPSTSTSSNQIASPRTALQVAASKRNSTPPQVPSTSKQCSNNSALSSTSQYHPLSAAAIKESFENSNNNNKFKGSPVTALKDEIDRRFMCNGTDNGVMDITPASSKGRKSSPSPHRISNHPLLASERYGRSDMCSPSRSGNPMANRPLPAVPMTHEDQLRSPAHRAALQNRRSFDDYNLSPSTSNSRNLENGDSPRRKAQRPMSAIVSSGTLYDNPANGYGYRIHEEDCAGQYVYGPNVQGSHGMYRQGSSPSRQGVSPNRQGASPNRKKNRKTNTENENTPEHVVLRYQNASPFQANRSDDPENCAKSKPGKKRKKFHDQVDGRNHVRLESLMCLDRSHIEDESLRHAPWYQAGIPREIALEILQQEDVGSFIVRDSTTHPGCFALSVRVPKFENANGISHYLVLKTQRGVKLKGLDKEWSNLTALVTHHTVMREMLPCTLRLPRKAKNPTFKASDKDDRDDDPDYQRLSDFSTMMAQLKM